MKENTQPIMTQSDIKIADVFNLPLVVHAPVAVSSRSYPIISASTEGNSICGNIATITISQGQYSGTSKYLNVELAEKMVKCAAHAINTYDANVARIAELEGAIDSIPVMDKKKYLSRDAWIVMDKIYEAKKLLEQSK